MDKQREKLIDLIQNSVGYCATYWATRIADHLLADKEIKHAFELLKAEKEGRLIVPPCKVGDKIYIIGDNLAEDVRRDKPIEVEVEGFIFDRGNKIVKIVFWESWLGKFIPIEDWNKTAFATFEDAEKALEERKQQ